MSKKTARWCRLDGEDDDNISRAMIMTMIHQMKMMMIMVIMTIVIIIMVQFGILFLNG